MIVSHDKSWGKKFADESDRIRQALGSNVIQVHHIGSTAIPGILAKPIIDILVEVSDLTEVAKCTESMNDLGYESLGEYGINGRRYFRKPRPRGRRSFHVHVFAHGSRQIEEHIAFRNYLLANPDKAKEYSDLKARIVANNDTSVDYQEAKSPFIEACIQEAIDGSDGMV